MADKPAKEKVQQEIVNRALRRVAQNLLVAHGEAKTAAERAYSNQGNQGLQFAHQAAKFKFIGMRDALTTIEAYVKLEPDIVDIINRCDRDPIT